MGITARGRWCYGWMSGSPSSRPLRGLGQRGVIISGLFRKTRTKCHITCCDSIIKVCAIFYDRPQCLQHPDAQTDSAAIPWLSATHNQSLQQKLITGHRTSSTRAPASVTIFLMTANGKKPRATMTMTKIMRSWRSEAS